MCTYYTTQKLYSWAFYPREIKTQNLYTNPHSSFISNRIKPGNNPNVFQQVNG